MRHARWPHVERLAARLADSALPVRMDRHRRSDGVHASGLLRHLHTHDNDFTEEQLNTYAIIGLAFEDRVEAALTSLAREQDWPWRAVRPGEVERDGILCSPDVLLVSKEDGTFVEMSIKATWKSCRDVPQEPGYGEFPPKFAYYFDQCMTYATPLDTLASVLLVYFVNGDYKPPTPQIHAWDVSFTKRERAETWQALVNIKRQIGG